jgi:hypothetical protein
MDGAAREQDFLHWCLRQPAVCPHNLAARRPDFLVISPPKTGSTWLAHHLRRHPQLHVPAIKEVKYFSCFLRWLDLNWYLDHFAEGEGQVKGEASPSYAILPVERIRLIRRLMPDLKLIYLMREPIGRAWSHARHNHRHREVNLARCEAALDAVPEERWRENFTHDWPLASGDYLGQLRRWTSVFPREQLFVTFYERIASGPEALLRDLFAFLGVRPDVALDGNPLNERILEGPAARLSPSLEGALHRLFHDRTRELAGFLKDRFGLRPPPEWERVLRPAAGPGADFEALDFGRVVALEGAFPSAGRGVLAGHRGYEVVCHQGRLYAFDQALGALRVGDLDEGTLRQYQGVGWCFVAPSLAEVTRLIDEHLFQKDQEHRRWLERRQAELSREPRDARERLARLEVGVGEVIAALNEAREELGRVGSFRYWARRAWRSARRLAGATPAGGRRG